MSDCLSLDITLCHRLFAEAYPCVRSPYPDHHEQPNASKAILYFKQTLSFRVAVTRFHRLISVGLILICFVCLQCEPILFVFYFITDWKLTHHQMGSNLASNRFIKSEQTTTECWYNPLIKSKKFSQIPGKQIDSVCLSGSCNQCYAGAQRIGLLYVLYKVRIHIEWFKC